MKEESINKVTKAVEKPTDCTTKTDMKSEPIDDVEIGEVLVPEIRDDSEPMSSDVICRSDPTAMEVGEILRPMSCDACGFKTDEKSIFEDHVRTHAENQQIAPDSLELNPSSEHAPPEQTQMLLVCNFCNFTVRDQSVLLKHMNTHVKNETPDDPVQLRTTSITATLDLPNEPLPLIEYRINDGLSESSQSGETVAEDVSKDGANRLWLKVSGEHSLVSGPSESSGPNSGPNKRYTCDVCGYKTNKKVTFEDHLRTHTGEKPFACDICSYRSSSKHTLGKHKKIHTRPKTFKCDSCEFRGSARSDLARHMKTHAKSYALHNGGFVPSDRLQIGTPVTLPMQIGTPVTLPMQIGCVEPNVSTSSSDAPSTAPELVLLNSAALDGFEETPPRILQPTDGAMLGSRTESPNDPLGSDAILDGPPNDPLQMELSDELSQDDTSNSLEPIQTGNPRFTCDFCSYSNNRRHEYEVHLRTHTGETPFACDLCDKKYIAKKTLNRHKKSRHGEQQFGCPFCNYRAARKLDIDEHVRSRHNTDGNANEPSKTEFEAQCEPVNDRLASEQAEEHRDDSNPSWAYEVIDTRNNGLTCDECGYETQQKLDLESHMMTHSGEKVFACELCDKKCTARRTLDRHLRENHGEKRLYCGLCDYSAKKKSDLTRHVQTHIKTEVENVSSQANKVKLEFEMELNEVSNYSGPSESSQLGNDPSKTEFETYEPTNDPLQLNLSEEHSQDSSLSRHSEAEVFGTKNYRFKCDVCGYKTSRKYEFTVHSRTHTGEKPYGCTLCDYRSIKKSYVNKHMKTHLKNTNSTGDTANVLLDTNSSYSQAESDEPKLVLISDSPELNKASGYQSEGTQTVSLSVDENFTCDHCDYKCDDLTAWSQHMFEHTREKSFSCDDCDYQTKDIGRFNMHKKVHVVKVQEVASSVTLPVSSVTITCEFCDYPFTTRADMSEHIMACHPEKCPHGCDFCDFKAFSVRSLELHKETHAVSIKVEESLLSRVTSAHVKEYVCYSCDYKASNVEDVEQHISTTHNLSTAGTTSLSVTTELPLNQIDASVPLQPDVQEYVCYACDYKASEISQVEEHILRTHSAPLAHDIAVPLSSLTSESPENYLVTSASNVGLEEYVCYACDYKACSVALVQQHIQVTHNPSNSESNCSPMEVTSEASSSVQPL